MYMEDLFLSTQACQSPAVLPRGGRGWTACSRGANWQNLALRPACLTQSAKRKFLKALTDQHLKIQRFHVKIRFPDSLGKLKFGNLSMLPAWQQSAGAKQWLPSWMGVYSPISPNLHPSLCVLDAGADFTLLSITDSFFL